MKRSMDLFYLILVTCIYITLFLLLWTGAVKDLALEMADYMLKGLIAAATALREII